MNRLKKYEKPNLDASQRRAVERVDDATLLLAVPGSGKTTTLLARLGHMVGDCGIDPRRILVITFTNGAANEMKDRYAKQYGEASIDFMTINSFCYRVVLYYAQQTGRPKPRDEVNTMPMIRQLFKEVYSEPFPNEQDIRDAGQTITFIKNMQLSEGAIEDLKIGDHDAKPLYDAYVEAMSKMNAMDFDDQLVYAYKLLKNVPGVRDYFQQKYPYVCVDEAQDTSHLQHEILRLLVGEKGNLFMVGDEDQSIYGFRAAYPEALMRFKETYANSEILSLETNYRSAKSITTLADKLIRHNKKRYEKHMHADRDEVGEVIIQKEPVRSAQYDTILELLKAEPKRETAILYRNNDSGIPLAYRLEKEGVPYRNRGLDALFFQNKVVLDAIDILNFAMHPSDTGLFWRMYYKLNYRLSKKIVYDATQRMNVRDSDPILSAIVDSVAIGKRRRDDLEDLRQQFQWMRQENRAHSAIQRIRSSIRYRNEKSEKLFILEALADPGETIPEYIAKLRHLERVIAERAEQGGSSDAPIILSTVHGSKGKEYDRVIVIDAVNGILPSEDNDMEEERRIFYVAITRAMNTLVLFDYRDCRSPFMDNCLGLQRLVKKKEPTFVDSEEMRAKAAQYVAGNKVLNRRFGIGTICERDGDKIAVDFGAAGVKRFVLSIVLEKGSLEVIE